MEKTICFGLGAALSGIFAWGALSIMRYGFGYDDAHVIRALFIFIVVSGGFDLMRRCTAKH